MYFLFEVIKDANKHVLAVRILCAKVVDTAFSRCFTFYTAFYIDRMDYVPFPLLNQS